MDHKSGIPPGTTYDTHLARHQSLLTTNEQTEQGHRHHWQTAQTQTNFLTMATKLRTVLSPLLLSHEEPTEENGEGILNRAAIWIWITANSYVRLQDDSAVEDRHEQQFWLSLTDTDKHRHRLSIHASTLEEAIICLDYLVGLQDTHFEVMELTYIDDYYHRLCPFGANILENMLQNSARRIGFNYMIFAPNHCRTLASSGTKTFIEFFCCEFQDEGAAFVEASAVRQDESSGPTELYIEGSNPFNDRNWALFLRQHKLDSLKLSCIELDSEVSCRAVATAQVQYLELDECDLEDEGAALIESMKQGRGPKGLYIDRNPFGSTESFVTFMKALRGNTYLERLDLWGIGDRQVTQALAAALHGNKGLVHLSANFGALDDSGRTELLEAISMHPSLRSLDLKVDRTYIDVKKRITKAVADMLSVNERVEEMRFDHNLFDEVDWNTNVSPRLECNLYRKRFLSIQTIGDASIRAAVLARALGKFHSKPHLVWMLLNQHHDIVSSYLPVDSAHDQTSTSSRKRSRSPSLDGIDAH
jgi:hypothetical protein